MSENQIPMFNNSLKLSSGIIPADRASTWASYALVATDEVAEKPAGLEREEAAVLNYRLARRRRTRRSLCMRIFRFRFWAGVRCRNHAVIRTRIITMLISWNSVCLLLVRVGLGVFLYSLLGVLGLILLWVVGSFGRNRAFFSQEVAAAEVAEHGGLSVQLVRRAGL
ncbi:hypothetical protein N7447_000939 [Penicillium robsamsonii]|uniref:uncharacterized protein n=1 Tax=Penicillium robsamsonii TaxID=1792511 RepID=UPI0025479F94|nr:uncharacterized protein N7447_000939 [Penicillium robsamsonii]KAJ5834913.1 hypothetical protein N7447_000939 [Penicillium robsamsonii]